MRLTSSSPRFTKPSSSMRLIILVCAAAILAGCGKNKRLGTDQELAQERVEEMYKRGKQSLDRGNYSFAIQYYQLLEANFPYGKYTEQAKLDMIFALDKAQQVEEAVEAADNFIALYPTHEHVDYAYYMKGVASFAKQEGRLDKFIKGGKDVIRDPKPYRDSESAFKELIKRYPNSKYTEDAKQRIVYIRNALANRELAVANFYFENETYLAAVNRCKTIVYQYETSPAVEGALVLMEKAYAEMGLDDLAASTHQVLLENFPNNETKPAKAKKKSILSKLNPFN